MRGSAKPRSPLIEDDSRRRRRVAATLTILGLLISVSAGLRAEGRLWTCACGEVYLWAGDIWSAHNSQHLLDPYSLTHLLHGVVFAWLVGWGAWRLWPAWQLTLALILESGWELFENSTFVIERYRTATIALGYTGDTVVNSVGDIVMSGIGFVLARYLGGWRSVGFFLTVEVLLLIWIRDSLLLNIVMLIYPIESLRAWQMGG